MPPFRRLVVVAALGVVACSSESPPAVTMALGRSLAALNLGVNVTVELDVTCGGATTTASQDVALTDTDTQVIVFPGLPVCGDATLTVRVLAPAEDGGAPVLAFRASQTSPLNANTTVNLTFTGPARGELVIAPSVASVCAIPDESGGTTSVEVNAAYRVSLPVGSYTITCTSSTAPDVTMRATTTVGKRVSIPFVFTPIDAAVGLATITVDGTQVPGFAQQKDLFAMTFDYTKAVVIVSATAQRASATVAIAAGTQTGAPAIGAGTLELQLSVGVNEVVITVTNGAATHAYTVDVRRSGPRVSNITFTGADAVDPPFDMNNAGPYTVYYGATLQPLAQLDCDPDCTQVPVTVDGAQVSVLQNNIASSFPPGRHGVIVSSTKADGTAIDYKLNVLHGALSNIACDAGTLTPAFDPGITSYAVLVTQTTGSITCTPTAFAPATTQAVTMDLSTGDVVFPIISQRRTGEPIDSYAISIIHQLTLYDYDAQTDNLEVGSVVDVSGRRAAVLTPNIGPPIRESVRYSGSNTIYFLQSNGSDDNGIGTRTLASDSKLNARPLVPAPNPSFPPDYVFGLPVTGAGLVAHPTAKVLFTYGTDGSFYRVPLTGLFQDAPNAGSQGMPGSVDPIGVASVSDGGNGSRLFMKADGTYLVWFGLGSLGPNFAAVGLDATTGDSTNSIVQQTLPGALSDIAYGTSGNVFLTSSSAGLQPYRGSGAPIGLDPATITGGPTSDARIVAHPTRPLFYAWTADQIFTLSYDIATGNTVQVGTAASTATSESVIAVTIDQRGQLFALITSDVNLCNLSTGAFDSEGRIATWAGATPVSCTASTLHFANVLTGAAATAD